VLPLHYQSTKGVYMYNLIGKYRVKIDAKGRVKLPKDLLRQLSDGSYPLVVNRGYEKHLMLYPKDVWEKKTKEINQLKLTRRNQRSAIRYFYRGATELNLDNIQRVLVPKALLEYAGIDKDIVLFAYDKQIELWDLEAYERDLENEPENFDVILENLHEEEKAEKAINHE